MKTKPKKPRYTSAPWFSIKNKILWQKPESDLPEDSLFNGTVAICVGTEDDLKDEPPEVREEVMANVRLLKKAPEMIELLNWIRNRCCDDSDLVKKIEKLFDEVL